MAFTFSEATKFFITAQEKEDKVGEGSVIHSVLKPNISPRTWKKHGESRE
jgi:hypothetical protein